MTEHAPGPWFFVVRHEIFGVSYSLQSEQAIKSQRNMLGEVVEVIELPPDYRPTLAQAIRDYKHGIRPKKKSLEEPAPVKDDDDAAFLARLLRIIETSDHEGERMNAQALYDKLTKPINTENNDAD